MLTIIAIIFQLFINMLINAIKDWSILVTYPMIIMLDELNIPFEKENIPFFIFSIKS